MTTDFSPDNAYTDLQASFKRVIAERNRAVAKVSELLDRIKQCELWDAKMADAARAKERKRIIEILRERDRLALEHAAGDYDSYDMSYDLVADFLEDLEA